MPQSSLGNNSKKELQIVYREALTKGRTEKIGLWLSILFLMLFGIVFFFVANSINQEFNNWQSFSSRLHVVIFFITCGIVSIILHEASHGVFMLAFTQKLPKFGCKGMYPYAALPRNIQVRRNKGLVISLAPLVMISIFTIVAMPFVSGSVTRGLFIFATFNASLCSLDVLWAKRLLKYGKDDLWGRDDDLVNVIYRQSSPTDCE